MKWLKNKFLEMSLQYKLIVSFFTLILIPSIIIGGTLSWLYLESNRSMLLESAVSNNKQITNNIDTAISPLLRLSMYPVQDKQIFQIMKKDYNKVAYPLYERARDFDSVNNIIKNSMLLYTDISDSIIIYQNRNNMIVGRSNTDYLNQNYLNNEFLQEPFIKEIMREKGKHLAIGIHNDELTSTNKEPVVSIGRAILDPYKKDNLGFILFNISVEKLKSLWNNITFTENTSFFLLDQNNNIIYSEQSNLIGEPIKQFLGEDVSLVDGYQTATNNNQDIYLITSTSNLTGWKAVTSIPKRELFSFLYTMIKTISFNLLILLVLSIIAAIYIAKTITKPLSILEDKMNQVSNGDLDVKINIEHGEIGKISNTIDNMLAEIRELINRIYKEETEKNKLELLALQSQINPHFMYNTINVIKWMAKIQGSTGIEQALSSFSSVIKFTAKVERSQVTVREELDFIKNYISILELRYMNKFEVEYDVEESVLDYKILKFLLQPLVENAIFHGFDQIDYRGKLGIHAHEIEGKLYIYVSDNGRGIDNEVLNNGKLEKLNSIGINNIRKRIDLNYGEQYGLYINSEKDQGTTAKIILPIIKG